VDEEESSDEYWGEPEVEEPSPEVDGEKRL
jgi:hypothetical protein